MKKSKNLKETVIKELNMGKNMKNTIILGDEQEKMFKLMENTYDNYVITGKAGSGKSELLKYFMEHSSKKVIVVAPTGIAALNIGGMTIHRLFHFDWGIQNKERIETEWYQHQNDVLKEADVIIFDEGFMIRPDLFEAIDIIMRNTRKCALPFGGIQVIIFGDPYQLPPVINDNEDLTKYMKDTYGGYFFFDTPSFIDGEFKIYELTNVFRQSDVKFIKMLNQIRDGSFTLETLKEINKRVLEPENKENIICLNTTRREAETINTSELSKLKGEEYVYTADIEGNLNESAYPTDYEIKIKEGAHVIMVANDQKGRWVNGTPATITKLTPNSIEIKIDGTTYPIEKTTWNTINYKYDIETKSITQEIVGSFKQYPIKLAWAMTIHKSQSKTCDSVLIDLGKGAFEYGQVYVALSRCKTLDRLYLKKAILPKDIKVHPEIKKFMRGLEILRFE